MKRRISAPACSNVSREVERASNASSAPKISISVSTRLPPAAASRSLTGPAGVGGQADNASDPPHFRPIVSADAGAVSRSGTRLLASSATSAQRSARPACARIMRSLAWLRAGMAASSSSWLLSQPSLPARRLHWDCRRAASRARVPERSSPSCEQPCGWPKLTTAEQTAWRMRFARNGLHQRCDAADRRGPSLRVANRRPRGDSRGRPARASCKRRRRGDKTPVVALAHQRGGKVGCAWAPIAIGAVAHRSAFHTG